MVTAKERQIADWERQIVEREAKIKKRKKKGLKVNYIKRAIKTLKTKIRLAKATTAAEKLRIARATPGVSYTVVGLGGKVLETRGAPKPKAAPKPAPKATPKTVIDTGAATALAAALTREPAEWVASSAPTVVIDVEQRREEKQRAYNVSVAGKAAAARKAAEIKKKKRKVVAREASLDRAIEIYQQTVTPLSERVREIQIERPGIEKGVEAGREARKEAARREGATFAEAEEIYGAAEAVEVPTIVETVEQATEELVSEGYEEEDIRTPFVELGGVKETGFLAPYVLEKIEEEAGVPSEERAEVTEPFRDLVISDVMAVSVTPLVPDTPVDPRIDSGIRRLLLLMFGATLIKYLAED